MKIENFKLEGKELPILTYPDPILSQVAKPVENFTPELENLVQNMLYTMYQAPGIGLAAPQVGISERIFVMDVSFDREVVTNSSGKSEFKFSNLEPLVLINPIISGKSGTITYEEGCLSVPGIYEEVQRFEKIHVKYQDLKGNHLELEADELLSICIQHENDHLEGIVFIERLSNLKKNFYKKKLFKEKGR